MQEPFALQLFREFLDGKSIAELSGESGIPADRIERRLRAAALHQGCRRGRDDWQREIRMRAVRR